MANKENNPAVAAIQYALNTDEGMTFLRCWNEGDFDSIRKEWSDVPDAVFEGADPCFKPRSSYTTKDLDDVGLAASVRDEIL